MDEWQFVIIIVVVAVYGHFAYGVLSDIRTEVRLIRERPEASPKDADSLSSTLAGIATELERLSVLTKYPYMLGAYSLEELAWQREMCAFLRGKTRWRSDELLGTPVAEDAAVANRFAEQDMAQLSFQYRKLTLMIQANHKVAAGVESIREARMRVETEAGTEPHPGAEMGSGVEYWNTNRLVKKLLTNGVTFPEDEVV